MALYIVLAVSLLGSCCAAPPVDSDLVNYDVDSDTWDLNSYGETYDYDDLDEEVENAGISVSVVNSGLKLNNPYKRAGDKQVPFFMNCTIELNYCVF